MSATISAVWSRGEAGSVAELMIGFLVRRQDGSGRPPAGDTLEGSPAGRRAGGPDGQGVLLGEAPDAGEPADWLGVAVAYFARVGRSASSCGEKGRLKYLSYSCL